ncbi:mitochondrial potassium channel ATP-binding subunit isoform X1 [Drosophila subobscura]|uniref:mitochondrial potassium channel ATP-binding subunit isoform X1 n=1 Tax=Drosophila subobscura TaxID=7241 RepID=UPI00155AA81E|nr:mitochondrial potassium channel ATP-binding subunit isoform X1 [Drosophila subobscura]
MLRLLVSNCSRSDPLSRCHLLPHLPLPLPLPRRQLSSRLQNATRLLRQHIKKDVRLTPAPTPPPSTSNASRLIQTTRALLWGGGSLTLGLGARGWWAGRGSVHCEGSRLMQHNLAANEEEEHKFDWKRLWSYLEPHLWELIGAIVAALIVAFINIRIPNILGDLVDTLARYGNTYVMDPIHNSFVRDVSKPATNLLSLYMLQSGFTFLYIYLLSRVGEQVAAKMRQDLFKQIVLQDIAFFDENRTGELVNRLTADVQDFKTSFKQFVAQGLRSSAQLIGGSISLFIISPHMAAIALASVPCVVTFMSYLGRKLRSLSKSSQAQAERATGVCEEALSNIRTVRSSACEYREMQLFESETNEAARLAQELGYGIAVFQGLTNFFLNTLVLSTLFMGGHLMSTESLKPGALMAFLVASQGVQRSLSQGSILLGTMIRGMTAGSRVFEFLSLEPQVDLLRGYVIPQERLHGEIRFENVSFSYPMRPDHVVLKDFTLTLRPGQTVALVGASGSGKSTIAALVERFYEPTTGNIKLDGYKLSDISPYWLRANVLGFIEQQPILFGTSILENIRYGKPDAGEKDVYEASKLAQSHEFVTALPDGYSTHVGERGTQLSGGQRQRIAIARALLKNPRVLILDEATSALDATSEAEVQKALDTAVQNRTTLVIAHRLSTIRNADLIVVLDQGHIVESGRHGELMARRGLYYALVRQQERRDIQEQQEHAVEAVAATTQAAEPANAPTPSTEEERRPSTAQG